MICCVPDALESFVAPALTQSESANDRTWDRTLAPIISMAARQPGTSHCEHTGA